MERNLLFEFTVNKPEKTVYITREFAAELPLVWDAVVNDHKTITFYANQT